MLDYISAVYEGLKDEYRRWRDGSPPPQPQPAAVNPPASAPKKMVPPSKSHTPARDALPPLKNWAHPVGDKSNPLVQLTNLAKATAGYFPVGRYGMWHGGVHFDSGTAGTLDQSHVRCLADGEVVAYRIASQTPITIYHTTEEKLVQAQFSVGFVLVRHHLQARKLESSPDTPPSLIFYSLYMHLQDWQSYEMLPQTPRPVFWKANSYRVKADVADLGPLGVTVHAQPKAGSSVLRELERGQRVAIRGSRGYVELRSVDGAALATPGYVRIDALESTGGEYRVRQDALGQVKGQHLNVHAEAKAKSTVLATLPRGTQVVVSGEGEFRKLESVLAVEPTGPASDDFKSPQGYLRFSALEPVIAPQQVDVIVIPEQPIPIKAGALIGHIGPYQTDVGQPQYKLHLETFTAENLPKFLEASREWAKRLPEKDRTWLKLAKGTSVVTAHQGSGPPSVVTAGTPSGNDLLIPRSLLDGLRAEDKRVVAGEKFNWYRLTGLLNDSAGKPLDGWVCETVGVTPWVSPWHWDGYATIHDYGPLPDGLAHSLNLRGLLADADVERLRPRIDRWDQGSVQSRLYDIIDSNRDGKLAADEIQTALGIPAKAQSISQLVIEYESEWHYRQAKWDDLDEVLGHTSSTPLLNWMAEKQRILELKWWSDVAGRVGLPEGGRVYHLHPVGLVSGFQSMTRRITVELIEKITGKTGDWFTGAGGGRTFYREFSEKYPNVYKFDKSLFVDLLNDSLEIYGIVGAYQQAHFLAQCFHESAHFETTIEFTSGDRYNPGNHPDAIKNGNTNAGDGPKYKGKGLIQLTWKKNYRLYSDFKGDDFVISPNLLAEDMHIAIDASCWFWRYNGSIYKKYNANGDINVLVDNEPNNVTLITLAVNGGDNGLPERKRLFESIKKEWDLI